MITEWRNTVLQDEQFIMSPKVDFAFKLIFGDENNKDILADFLSKVLKRSKEEFEDIELLNLELPKEFQEDKKGILDVRIKTKDKKHIDIEIQVIPHEYMPERSLFYWGKMYVGQIKSGFTYDCLQKCITINIVDFNCIPVDKIHTSFHITEDQTGHRLSEVLEMHFLELKKAREMKNIKDIDDPAMTWVEFLNAKTKGEMEMLAAHDANIKKAYDILEVASKDEKARMAYEARQAEIMDQMTREKTAREQGLQQGLQQGEYNKALEVIKNALQMKMSIEQIVMLTGYSEDKVQQFIKVIKE